MSLKTFMPDLVMYYRNACAVNEIYARALSEAGEFEEHRHGDEAYLNTGGDSTFSLIPYSELTFIRILKRLMEFDWIYSRESM